MTNYARKNNMLFKLHYKFYESKQSDKLFVINFFRKIPKINSVTTIKKILKNEDQICQL